jgi:hypothetical protein
MAPVDLHPAAVEEGDEHEPSLERQALQVPFDIVAADHVEHDVHAALGRDPRHLDGEILLPVFDDLIGTDAAAKRGLLRVAHRRDDARPECLRQLDGREPDPARAAMHEQRFALAQVSALEYVVPYGEIIFRQACCFKQRQAARQRQAVGGRRRAILRVATTRGKRTDGIADAPWFGTLAQRDDRSRDFEPEDGGCVGRRRIMAGALHAIGAVDASVGDANQHLASPGCRHLGLRDSQHVRRSRLARQDIVHRGRQLHGGARRDRALFGRTIVARCSPV